MSIPPSFTIILDDAFITNPPNDNDEARIQAQADVNSGNAAIFSLNNGILESGDWYLGRFLVEDRSLLPKRVFWLKKEDTEANFVHRTEIEQLDGNVYGVKNGGTHTYYLCD